VTQLITALVSIHGSMTFLADMYSFLDPPGRTVLFSVDDRSLVLCYIVRDSYSQVLRAHVSSSYVCS